MSLQAICLNLGLLVLPIQCLTSELTHSFCSCMQGKESYTLAVLASDIKGAIFALGHSRCTLMAHDWGGAVAWTTAGMYADATAGAAATAAAAGGGGGSKAHGLLDGLIVLGLPHFGISMTNFNSEQDKRSSYMITFQVSNHQSKQQCWLLITDDRLSLSLYTLLQWYAVDFWY